MKTAMIQTRVNVDLRNEAESLFESFGLDTTTAIRLFLKQVVNQRKIPFDILPEKETPNKETRMALQEADELLQNPNTKKYESFSEILSEVADEI